MQSGLTEADFPHEYEIPAYDQQPQTEPQRPRNQVKPVVEWLQASPPYVPWGLDMEAGLAALKRAEIISGSERDVLRTLLVAALGYRSPSPEAARATEAAVEVPMSLPELSYRAAISDSAASKAVRNLQRQGLLGARRARGGHRRTTYLITPATLGRIRAAAEGGTDYHPRVVETATLESGKPRSRRKNQVSIKEVNTLAREGKGGKSTQSTGGTRVQRIAHGGATGEDPLAVIDSPQAEAPTRKKTAQRDVSNSKPTRRSDAAPYLGDGGEGSSRPSQALTGVSEDAGGSDIPGWTDEAAMEAVCELVARHDRGDFQHQPQLHDEIAHLIASRAPDAELQLFAISKRLGITGRNLGAVVNDPTQGQAAA